MPPWLLELFHALGLTNLTDNQVRRYREVYQWGQSRT